jgi:hypothetical protein
LYEKVLCAAYTLTRLVLGMTLVFLTDALELNAVKSQIWIAVSVYVLVATVGKRKHVPGADHVCYPSAR